MLPHAFVLDVTHTGQAAIPQPPAGMVCPPGQSPALSGTQWSCAEPLVQTHPILAVLLVLGFFVVFAVVAVGSLFFSII